MERCIKEIVEDILLQINAEIESVELDNEIELDDALRIIKFIQPMFNQLREYVMNYVFPSISAEIHFSRNKSLKFLVGYYTSIKYIALKCNFRMAVMKSQENIFVMSWIV